MIGLAPNCEKVNNFLAEYFEGTLPEKTRKQFEDHIGMCKCCGPYFDQYRDTIAMVKDGQEIKIPKELVEHTMVFLRSNVNFSS